MATKKQTNKALVRNIDKINCSVYGNPRYHAVLHNLDNNDTMRGNTASDHQFVYCMPTLGAIVFVKWHKTKKGNIIFDDMEIISKGIDD